MLLEADQNLEELITKVLALRPGLSVQKIQLEVTAHSRKYSLQAIYKALERLQTAGVVVRVQKVYSLSMSWALDLVHLGDIIYDTYVANAALTAASPPIVHRQSWRCYDFVRLANFWPHIRLSMVHHTGVKTIYDWLPHPWFHLVDPRKHEQFERVANQSGIQVYAIVGGDTTCDKELTRMWSKQVFNYSHAPGPFADEDAHYFSVVGDYVFSSQIEKTTAAKLTEFFNAPATSRNKACRELPTPFESRTKFKLTVSENPVKAKRLRKKFNDFFGLPN